jgi:hypothetical protein
MKYFYVYIEITYLELTTYMVQSVNLLIQLTRQIGSLFFGPQSELYFRLGAVLLVLELLLQVFDLSLRLRQLGLAFLNCGTQVFVISLFFLD